MTLFRCCFVLSFLLMFSPGITPVRAEPPYLSDLIEILGINSGKTYYYRTFPDWLDRDSNSKITLADGIIVVQELSNPIEPPALPGTYTLLAWNDLGMHCVDGNDYSVFSILPPYNNLHAQLIRKDVGLVPSGVTITFEAIPNLKGAFNTNSVTKTNFWQYAEPLYGFLYGGGTLQDDEGITGIFTQSRVPQELEFDLGNQWWAAEGIPILPYNDNGTKGYYQLVKVKAKAVNGDLLAMATAVLPVSDEMDCRKCHGSNSNYPAAEPSAGWVNNADPEKDYKFNILRLHDETNSTALFAQAESGTPVLCASCHESNALPGSGNGGRPLTQVIHSAHAGVLDPVTLLTLDADTNRTACYSCHPGDQTKCLRGAMGGPGYINCQDCHGNLSDVGSASREGWLDEPNCQQCHQNGVRYSTVFDSSGNVRPVTDSRFATNPDTPSPGKSLYRFSTGHQGIQCEACHGATHAVYPSVDEEDNLLAKEVQGHAGTIAECTACHTTTPRTSTGGPHGMHSVGNYWVNAHEDVAEDSAASCKPCHGAKLRGSVLSEAFSKRIFSTEWGIKRFAAGQKIGCYNCHDGPDGD